MLNEKQLQTLAESHRNSNGQVAIANPNAIYNLKGHEIKERQIFLRHYHVNRKPHTGTYFIDSGRAYSISAEDGEVGRCNFSAEFLNSGHTKSIVPLEEFYEGIITEA